MRCSTSFLVVGSIWRENGWVLLIKILRWIKQKRQQLSHRVMESARIKIRIFSDTPSKESERPTGPHYTPVAAAIVPFLPVTNVSLSRRQDFSWLDD